MVAQEQQKANVDVYFLKIIYIQSWWVYMVITL